MRRGRGWLLLLETLNAAHATHGVRPKVSYDPTDGRTPNLSILHEQTHPSQTHPRPSCLRRPKRTHTPEVDTISAHSAA
uniref:Putative secreted protein n=1 Tax=Anopheles darlingi TaxID=43151 RepID=A0A2M4D545_ANODA